ncbi:MAG: VCBS repeat-containing protein [Pseudomonadota bacterium]
MTKQSRVVKCAVRPGPVPGAAVLQTGARVGAKQPGSRWQGFGRASGVFSLGLLAALAAPREAKAVGFFTDNTATTLGLGAQQPCGDTLVTPSNGTTAYPDYGCYTSWLATVDIDGDGDFDILMANGGGYYAVGPAEESTVFLNDGHAAFQDVTPTQFAGAHNRNRQVAAGDIDGDGDIDIYQPGGFGVDKDKLFVQTAPGVFQDQAATLLPNGLMSHAGSVHMGDLDGDGDLDIVIGDWTTGGTGVISRLNHVLQRWSREIQAGRGPERSKFRHAQRSFPPTIPPVNNASTPYYGVRAIDLDFADVDGDFDLDILVNHRNGYSRIFLNDGHANFTDGTGFVATTNPDNTVTITANYPPKQGPYVYNQEVCDLDEDGDLDILLDNAGKVPADAPSGGGSDVSQVLINNGHGVFQPTTRPIAFLVSRSRTTTPSSASTSTTTVTTICWSRACRTPRRSCCSTTARVKFNYVADAFPTIKDNSLGIDVADLNGDGIIDVVTGQGEGSLAKDGSNQLTLHTDRVYFGAGAAAVDTIPPVFRGIETPVPVAGEPIVFRLAVKDSATNEAGQMVKNVSVQYAITGGVTKNGEGRVHRW